MNLLAIDTSCSILCAAVSRDDELFTEEIEGAMKQSEYIMVCIDKIMNKASLKPADLNGVLCMKGPGSFTGLRIGYSIAKGLALSLSIPFASISTLDCVVHGLSEKPLQNNPHIDTALSIINASKNAFFYVIYNIMHNEAHNEFPFVKRLTQDKDGNIIKIIEEIKNYKNKLIITGPGTTLIKESLPQDIKDMCIINDEYRGYAKELIAIAKKTKILDNDNTEYLFSGPEYNRLPG